MSVYFVYRLIYLWELDNIFYDYKKSFDLYIGLLFLVCYLMIIFV